MGPARLTPDASRIDLTLGRVGVGAEGHRLAAIAPVHTHVDHHRRTGRVARHGHGVQVREAWSILIEHTSGRTALVKGSAGYVEGALAGRHADVAYLESYWAHTVTAVGARRVVLTHWDDFFRGLGRPLRALPYLGDDLDITRRVLTRLATEQGIDLHLPTLHRRENPWLGP